MVGLIVGLITILATVILALMPVIIKLLKWTGLWIPLLYIIAILLADGYIKKLSNGANSAWCYIGLYVCVGVSAIIFIINFSKAIRSVFTWIIDKVRGY